VATLPANCALLPTVGAGTPGINPIRITTTDSGVAGTAATSTVLIAPAPAAGQTAFQVNGSTVIQSATAGDRAYGSFSANGTQVGWSNGGANFTAPTRN
jgi:hypothetical protein